MSKKSRPRKQARREAERARERIRRNAGSAIQGGRRARKDLKRERGDR